MLRTFWQQQFSYGRGSFRRIRARRDHGRARVDPLAFCLRMQCDPYAQTQSTQAALLTALLLGARPANVAGCS